MIFVIVRRSLCCRGVKQLTMSLAAKWGEHGVTVNCLAPGWFRTAQTAVLYEDQAWVAYLSERIPLGRPGSPTDLYGAVVFLASDASHYVTGVRHSWLMEAYLLALSGLFQRSRAYSAIVYFAIVGAIESKRRMQ